jgi:hypothetical protein
MYLGLVIIAGRVMGEFPFSELPQKEETIKIAIGIPLERVRIHLFKLTGPFETGEYYGEMELIKQGHANRNLMKVAGFILPTAAKMAS